MRKTHLKKENELAPSATEFVPKPYLSDTYPEHFQSMARGPGLTFWIGFAWTHPSYIFFSSRNFHWCVKSVVHLGLETCVSSARQTVAHWLILSRFFFELATGCFYTGDPISHNFEVITAHHVLEHHINREVQNCIEIIKYVNVRNKKTTQLLFRFHSTKLST